MIENMIEEERLRKEHRALVHKLEFNEYFYSVHNNKKDREILEARGMDLDLLIEQIANLKDKITQLKQEAIKKDIKL